MLCVRGRSEPDVESRVTDLMNRDETFETSWARGRVNLCMESKPLYGFVDCDTKLGAWLS